MDDNQTFIWIFIAVIVLILLVLLSLISSNKYIKLIGSAVLIILEVVIAVWFLYLAYTDIPKFMRRLHEL
jgi:small neutral amino acid transporter SnatA (MarC family)